MSSLVYLKHPRGTTYVYENISYWDKTEKKTKHKRKCIGKLDPVTNEIVPTRRKTAKAETKADKCEITSIGPALILDKAVTETGIGNVLKAVFINDWDKILSCAYFLVCENRALSHMEQWSQEYRTPYGKQLTNRMISKLLERITPELQQSFFLQWINVNHSKSYLAVDFTSVSSYSKLIDSVRRGYSGEEKTLEQVNLIMVTDKQNKLPICYRLCSGKINDVTALKESLSALEIRPKPLCVAMDKGFYSDKNIDELYASHYNFIASVPLTSVFAAEEVKNQKDKTASPQNALEINADKVSAVTELTEWHGHRCYVHMHYDKAKQTSSVHELNKKLPEHDENKSHQELCEEHFAAEDDPNGLPILYSGSASNDFKNYMTGQYVLVSNCVKDAKEALHIYRFKDTAEKSFDNLKNTLDLEKFRLQNDKIVEGRIFIQFIAFILSTYLRNYCEKNSSKYKIPDIFSELNTYRQVYASVKGRCKRYRTAISKELAEIFVLFHIAE